MYLLSTVSSLELETFEQMALWQLVAAHSIPLSMLLSLLPKLKQDQHCEALTALMAMIKHERPNNDLMKALLSCPIESFISALVDGIINTSGTDIGQPVQLGAQHEFLTRGSFVKQFTGKAEEDNDELAFSCNWFQSYTDPWFWHRFLN
jgi:hypothetical protein